MISIVCIIRNTTKITHSLISSCVQSFQDWELKVIFYNNTSQKEKLIMPFFEDKRIEIKNYGEEFKTYIQTLLHIVNNDAVYNYIGILDENDIWEPNKLELQAAKLKEFPRIDVVGTKSKYDSDMEPELPINGLYNYNLFKVNPFINSSVVFKRDVLRYMQEQEYAEDIDTESDKMAQFNMNRLWLQLTIYDSVLYNINQVTLIHKTPYQVNHYKTCYESEYFKNIISDLKKKIHKNTILQ